MSTPVNCGTSFCSCIECVAPDREELEKAVEDAEAARTAALDIYAASVASCVAAVDIYAASVAALKAYDKENK